MIKYPQITEIPDNIIKDRINAFIEEDMPNGDLTSLAIFNNDEQSTAYFEAQENIILAGGNTIHCFFPPETKVEILKKDGSYVRNGETFARITGSTLLILSRERIMLNLIQRMSAIATITNQYVKIAQPYGVKILDTRKTTPGLRIFEKYAVAIGGGQNHRFNLSTGILIKDNHIAAAGGIAAALNRIHKQNYSLPIEIEVENESQIIEAINAGTEGLLLDNMTPEELIHAVKLVRNLPENKGKKIFLEASGGINLDNLKNYVCTGIDAISCGALTHSVKNANLHLEFE